MSHSCPRRCLHCRERAVYPAVLPSYTAEVEHDGGTYSITAEDFNVLQCKNCAAIVLDDAADERLSDALRQKVGLLSPAEIRGSREKLGLTQQQLADRLRISMYTLCRWETGAQIQKPAMDILLRIAFEPEKAGLILGAEDCKVSPGPSITLEAITK